MSMKNEELIALSLGTSAKDGTASSKSYIVIAKDEEKGAFIGIRPLGVGQFRMRMMPLQNLELSNWKAAFPGLPWQKSSDVRKSFVEGALAKIPEGCKNARLSFLKSRLGTSLISALKERMTETDIQWLVTPEELAEALMQFWANQIGYGDSLVDQLEKYKAMLETYVDTNGGIQKMIDKLTNMLSEEDLAALDEIEPAIIIKDFFKEPEMPEFLGEKQVSSDPVALMEGAEANQEEPKKAPVAESPQKEFGPDNVAFLHGTKADDEEPPTEET